jgi:hypothetical protein
MPSLPLALDPRLRRAARVPSLAAEAKGLSALELAVLLGAGAIAAVLTHLVRLRLGIPGSNIVWVAFPLAFGFAMVPRRGGGLVMSAGALATTGVLALAGVRLDGPGAQTSLLLTGPLLDLALRAFGGGWQLYAAFIGACAGSNAVAFAVKAAALTAGVRGGGRGLTRGFAQWWPEAAWTYAAAGVVAGLISAGAWFHLRDREEPPS